MANVVVKTHHNHGQWRIDLEEVQDKPNTYQVVWRINGTNQPVAFVELQILPNPHQTPSFKAIEPLADPWTKINQLYYCRVALDAIADHLGLAHP